MDKNISVQTEKNSDLIKKKLLSASVVKKHFGINPEKILHDHLYPKFGQRYLNYRNKYENYLKDSKHKFTPDYPISVILELVNRCDLECTMCYQGFRNDAKKSTLQLPDLENLFEDFKKINLMLCFLVLLNLCYIKIFLRF